MEGWACEVIEAFYYGERQRDGGAEEGRERGREKVVWRQGGREGQKEGGTEGRREEGKTDGGNNEMQLWNLESKLRKSFIYEHLIFFCFFVFF